MTTRSTAPLRVLVVEDNLDDAALMLDELRAAGFHPVERIVGSEPEYVAELRADLDVILCDYRMPRFSAYRALELLKESGLEVPFIIVSGSIGEELAVACIREGASDYLLKDRLARLGQSVALALDRKRGEAERARLAAIVESSGDAIIGEGLDGVISSWNAGAEQIYGFSADEAVGKPFTLIVPPDRQVEVSETRDRLRRGEAVDQQETVRVRKDGSEIHVSITVSSVHDAAGKLVGTCTIARDITARKLAEGELAFLAYHDSLTRLPNRSMFEEQLEAALARARRHDLAVAVIYLDLDNFKLVNDALGHRVGDDLLCEVAVRLCAAARETDVVARHGGDEFLILLPDLELGDDAPDPIEVVGTVAERIHDALRAPFVLQGTDLYASVSVGISIFPTTAPDAERLITNADAAMYRSKRAGPGRTIVAPLRIGDPLGRLSLVTDLRRAVEQRQWILRYQPVVDLADGRIVGAEALIRWKKPSGEEILPGEFLPLAQETGLMEEIGDWVVGEACRQARAWRDQGLSLLTTVNLSPPELRRRDVLRVVVDEVQSAGLEPSSMVIEVTETAAMMEGDGTHGLLQRFHDRGLQLAIDDFGTGYSSLSRLKNVPANILKIDRSFLQGVPFDPDAASVVIAIVELARTLGMVPLAEGVESRDQWDFLSDVGCTLGQGWLFGRPIAPEEVAAMVVSSPSAARQSTGARARTDLRAPAAGSKTFGSRLAG